MQQNHFVITSINCLLEAGFLYDSYDILILTNKCPTLTESYSKVLNLEEIEFLTFPRLMGYAEIGWTQDSLRNWDNYKTRLIRYLPSLEKRGINYYRSPLLVDYNKSGE